MEQGKTTIQLSYPSTSVKLGILIGSLTLHTLTILFLDQNAQKTPGLTTQRLPVQVRTVPKPPQISPPTPEAPAPPQAPRPKTRQKQAQPTQPVLGLTPESLSPETQGSMSVPLGNTTQAADEGRRLSPEDLRALGRDLSADAELIPSSFSRPAYTDEAEQAGLEGRFSLEVFVSAEGLVEKVELTKTIGYGMDERLILSARQARFKPRRNAQGQAISGWTEIKVRLSLD